MDRLPPEVVIHLCDFLSPVDVLSLALVNRQLSQVCLSDSVWRSSFGSQFGLDERFRDKLNKGEIKFLLQHAQYLGWHICDLPWRARVVYIHAHWVLRAAPLPPSSSGGWYEHDPTGLTSGGTSSSSTGMEQSKPEPVLTISAYILGARNTLVSASALARSYERQQQQQQNRGGGGPDDDGPAIPPGSRLLPPASYLLPTFLELGRSTRVPPDAGLTCDMLQPSYELRPLFEITREHGARMTMGRHAEAAVDPRNVLAVRLLPVQREVELAPLRIDEHGSYKPFLSAPPSSSSAASTSTPSSASSSASMVTAMDVDAPQGTHRPWLDANAYDNFGDEEDGPQGGAENWSGEDADDDAVYRTEELLAREERGDADLPRLFAGRMPARPWPSRTMVPLERQRRQEKRGTVTGETINNESAAQATLAALSNVRARGVLRAPLDWLRTRGTEREWLYDIRERETEELVKRRDTARRLDSPAFVVGRVEGFRVVVRRYLGAQPRLRNSSFTSQGSSSISAASMRNVAPDIAGGAGTPGGQARMGTATPAIVGGAPTAAAAREGVPANGGPAVIWHGGAPPGQDPRAPRRAIVRLLDNGTFATDEHHQHQRTNDQTLLMRVVMPGAGQVDEQDIDDRYVETESESYFPMLAPQLPIVEELRAGTLKASASSHGITARSLEGLWVAPYGAHGLEFGRLCVRLVRDYRTGRWRRALEYVKVTGDQNVPPGEISWRCDLPDAVSESELDNFEKDAGMVETTTFHDICALYAWQADSGVVAPDWTAGIYRGQGQIALTGFMNSSYVPVFVQLVRSTVSLSSAEPVASVEEIRLMWHELGKVTTFKRVRVDPAQLQA